MGAGLSNELINIGVLLAGARYLNSGLRTEGGDAADAQADAYRALLMTALRDRPAPLSTLEICAGFGRGADVAERDFGLRPDRLDISRVAAIYGRLRGKPHMMASVTSLPFADEAMDLIYGVECVICLDDPAEGALECARVLRKGGALAIAEFRLCSIGDARRRLNALAEQAGLRIARFEDHSDDARRSALVGAAARAKALRLIPPPFRSWAKEVASVPGSKRHSQWEARRRCYYIAVLEKP